MKRKIGLWIDHRQAIFIIIENNEQEGSRKIKSDVIKHIRKAGGLSAKTPNKSAMSHAENMIDRRYDNRLNRYYDRVISFARKADSILIFGPGEVKVELETRIKLNNLGDKIVGVETVGKMTEPQIAAKVRDHFVQKGNEA